MRTRHDPSCPSYQWGRIHDTGVTCRICDAIDALREQVAKPAPDTSLYDPRSREERL